MYGADAGGIVNIITRSGGDGFDGHVSAEGGRYDTRQLGADLAGGNEVVDFALSAADYSTGGFNARADDTVLRDDDGYDNTTMHGRIGWNATDTLRLELVARDVSGEGEYDNCFGSEGRSDDCENEYDQSAWRVAAELAADAFSHQLAYVVNETERQFYTEGLAAFGSEAELEKWSYLGRFQGGDTLSLVYGVDLQSETMDDGFIRHQRDQDGYYLEYQGSHLDDLYLTAGIRYDDNEDFGSHTTYRVSAAYVITMGSGELKLKGAYGTGFRAPSLYEIVTNDSPWAFPPASAVELQEEDSEGYDLGVVWANPDGLYLEVTYFEQAVENEIYYDLEFFSGYLQGDGETESSGIELVADVPLLDSLFFTGNYTYNDTEQSSGGQRARRPEHLANLGVTWRALDERLVLGLTVRGSYDSVDVDGSSLDDYEVVNLNASYDLTDSLNLYGRVENLLGADYEEVPNYNSPGAAAYAGVRYSF
jgi:vitamin B12 transporter